MEEQSGFKKWTALVVLSLALAIIIIDSTLLNVSLRTIITELHTDIESMQWVITAYSLMLAAFTITGGRLGDMFGRKKMFMLGAGIFAVGSFIASISTNVGMMIAGEAIIEGIGAVLMMPATASLLVANYKGRDRAIAFGVWGGIAAASSAIGPILGGWLTSAYSWRWGFRINIFIAALLLIGSILVKESKDTEEKAGLDIGGILLSASGLFLMVFGFIKSTDYGWIHGKKIFSILGWTPDLGGYSIVPLFILLGILVLLLFVIYELGREEKGKTPLVSFELFENRQFMTSASTTAILSLGQAGLIFSIPIFLQSVRNLDAFHTGLAMLPLSLTLLVAAPSSAYLAKFISPKRLIQFGMVFVFAGFMVLSQLLTPDASALSLAPGFIVFGLGLGLMMAQTNNLALSAVSVQEAGEASGVNNTFRQVGFTLGSAILGAVLLSTLTSNMTTKVSQSSVIPETAKPSIIEKISTQSSQIEFGNGGGLNDLPGAIKTEFTKIVAESTTDAGKTSLFYGSIFAVLGFIVSFFLPKGKNIETERSVAHGGH